MKNLGKMFEDARTLGLTIPERVNEVIDSKFIGKVPIYTSKVKFDLYSNAYQYYLNTKISQILGKTNSDIYYAQQEFPQMIDFLSKK